MAHFNEGFAEKFQFNAVFYAKPASPGRGPSSVMWGFSISVQPAKPASPIGLLCE